MTKVKFKDFSMSVRTLKGLLKDLYVVLTFSA